MLAAALGAVGYRPAIPLLVKALTNSDANWRGSAAWSLGALQAHEAVNALQSVLRFECHPYAMARMREALNTITRGGRRSTDFDSRLRTGSVDM